MITEYSAPFSLTDSDSILGSSVKVPVKLHVNPLIEISSNINDTVSFECTAIRNIKDSEYRENAADAYEVTNGTSTKTGNESTTSTLTVKGPAEGGKYTCIGTSFEHPRLVQNVDVYGVVFPTDVTITYHCIDDCLFSHTTSQYFSHTNSSNY